MAIGNGVEYNTKVVVLYRELTYNSLLNPHVLCEKHV